MSLSSTLKTFSLKLLREKLHRHGYQLTHNADLDVTGTDKYLDSDEFRYILMLDRVYQKIATVPGHIVEVGVARGRNSILFGHFIKAYGDQAFRRYYGFDTFEGYTPKARAHTPHLSKTRWKQTDAKWVRSRISHRQLSEISHIVDGDIEKTGPNFLEHGSGDKFTPGHFKTALLYVDCNAYVSALAAMEIFYPSMTPGSIICIDEKLQGGETKALQEFCKSQGLRMEKDKSPFSLPAYTVVE